MLFSALSKITFTLAKPVFLTFQMPFILRLLCNSENLIPSRFILLSSSSEILCQYKVAFPRGFEIPKYLARLVVFRKLLAFLFLRQGAVVFGLFDLATLLLGFTFTPLYQFASHRASPLKGLQGDTCFVSRAAGSKTGRLHRLESAGTAAERRVYLTLRIQFCSFFLSHFTEYTGCQLINCSISTVEISMFFSGHPRKLQKSIHLIAPIRIQSRPMSFFQIENNKRGKQKLPVWQF